LGDQFSLPTIDAIGDHDAKENTPFRDPLNLPYHFSFDPESLRQPFSPTSALNLLLESQIFTHHSSLALATLHPPLAPYLTTAVPLAFICRI
jgi:hypothetical protein